MVTLADGIELPILLVGGLVTFGPLTLAVAAIEAYVMHRRLRLDMRALYRPVLWANVLSTVLGILVLVPQTLLVFASGIEDSIPAFIRGYRWVAPLITLIYFTKSFLVEGLQLTHRKYRSEFDRSRRQIFGAVVLANVCSYIFVGPLFYYMTRPYFAGLETTFDAHWAADPNQVIYFISRADNSIQRKRIGSDELTTLIPGPASDFIVSADESTVAYVTPDGELRVGHTDGTAPVSIRQPSDGFFLSTVSLAPDNRRVAFLDPSMSHVRVLDLETQAVTDLGKVPVDEWGAPLAWSADGERVYALRRRSPGVDHQNQPLPSKITTYVFSASPPYGPPKERAEPPELADLVVNYGRLRGQPTRSRDGASMQLPMHLKAGPYEAVWVPYLGSALIVKHEGDTVLRVRNDYGLLNFSTPSIQGAVFLPGGDEILIDWWGQTYLLSVSQCKLGLAAPGHGFVARTDDFRVDFKPMY